MIHEAHMALAFQATKAGCDSVYSNVCSLFMVTETIDEWPNLRSVVYKNTLMFGTEFLLPALPQCGSFGTFFFKNMWITATLLLVVDAN
ncbi:hypothetical protein PsorP6_002491 [Peronosclerospora sorghi]|uniref:Uncharacterized protein n=1 Tax=Peronosclerospora sorghi TaxID=230839 RepID=A0ACC0WV22_9STRA|nr:hypothetical protein PsorP6_002491 [Peronosclerospora sorghi]